MLVTRTLEAFLTGVSPLDPIVFAATAFATVGVAVLAAGVPAWRATRVSPATALDAD